MTDDIWVETGRNSFQMHTVAKEKDLKVKSFFDRKPVKCGFQIFEEFR